MELSEKTKTFVNGLKPDSSFMNDVRENIRKIDKKRKVLFDGLFHEVMAKVIPGYSRDIYEELLAYSKHIQQLRKNDPHSPVVKEYYGNISVTTGVLQTIYYREDIWGELNALERKIFEEGNKFPYGKLPPNKLN